MLSKLYLIPIIQALNGIAVDAPSSITFFNEVSSKALTVNHYIGSQCSFRSFVTKI